MGIDLYEEARAKVIVRARFFHALSLKCPAGVRMLCYEAITTKIAIWPDRVFCIGYAATHVYFVESGRLAYIMEGEGEGEQSQQTLAMRSMLEAVRSVTSIFQSRRCISEAALWTDWMHLGDLSTVVSSTVQALDVQIFPRVVMHFHGVLSLVVDYGKRYIYSINKINGELSDLVNLSVPFARSVGALSRRSELQTNHYIFLSHYKVEAGTEAALMRDALCIQIETDPYHPAFDMSTPVFLDSEDLQNLKNLKEHVKVSRNLVVLLTTNFLRRPWCLIEITLSMMNNINIVPVRIERAGIAFEYPTEAFYEELREGKFLSDADRELFRVLGIDVSAVERAVRLTFQKVAVPFSPHKPIQVRALEVSTILNRCVAGESALDTDDRDESTMERCGSMLDMGHRESQMETAVAETIEEVVSRL